MSEDREWVFWVEEGLAAIAKIKRLAGDLSFQEFVEKEAVSDAVLLNIANIGEFSRHIPEDVRKAHSGIPWREIKDMRNAIAHDYPGVNWLWVWKAVQEDIPVIERVLLEILEEQAKKA